MCAALITRALNLASLVIAGTSRFNLRSRRGQRGVARTVLDPRCTRVATVGRLDPSVLSLRRARRFEKSLALVWMFARVGRNAQRTAVIRSAVFHYLATVAKKMDEGAERSCRVHSNCSADSFTMASANIRSLDRIHSCCQYQSFPRRAIQVAASRYVARRSFRGRRIRNRRIRRRQLRVVRNRLSLWDQALSVSVYQLVLQPCISARCGGLVFKR